MATVKRRVASYLNPEVEAEFNKYVESTGFGESEAINAILAEFFGISKTLHVSQLRKIIRDEIDKAKQEENDGRNGAN